MEVEQFSSLLTRRDGAGSCEVSGVGAGNQAPSGREFCRSPRPSHSQTARITGAPMLSWAPGYSFLKPKLLSPHSLLRAWAIDFLYLARKTFSVPEGRLSYAYDFKRCCILSQSP